MGRNLATAVQYRSCAPKNTASASIRHPSYPKWGRASTQCAQESDVSLRISAAATRAHPDAPPHFVPHATNFQRSKATPVARALADDGQTTNMRSLFAGSAEFFDRRVCRVSSWTAAKASRNCVQPRKRPALWSHIPVTAAGSCGSQS